MQGVATGQSRLCRWYDAAGGADSPRFRGEPLPEPRRTDGRFHSFPSHLSVFKPAIKLGGSNPPSRIVPAGHVVVLKILVVFKTSPLVFGMIVENSES